MKRKIRVYVVDDHSLVRQGIISLLLQSEEFEIIGEAASGKEAIEGIKSLKPDVVLLDISLPDITGIEVIKELRLDVSLSETGFLIISMFDMDEYYYRAVKAGALGVINKNIAKAELFEGIIKVHRGEMYFGKSVSIAEVELIIKSLDQSHFQERDPENIFLTNREKDVLRLLCEGLISKQIADKLGISQRTVEIYRSNLMQKFDVKTIGELIAVISASEKVKKALG